MCIFSYCKKSMWMGIFARVRLVPAPWDQLIGRSLFTITITKKLNQPTKERVAAAKEDVVDETNEITAQGPRDGTSNGIRPHSKYSTTGGKGTVTTSKEISNRTMSIYIRSLRICIESLSPLLSPPSRNNALTCVDSIPHGTFRERPWQNVTT